VALTCYRRHVFRDLRPYVCTFEKCQDSERLFVTRHEWVSHEQQMHRRKWICLELCEREFSTKAALEKHLVDQHTSDNETPVLSRVADMCERGIDATEQSSCPICRETMSLSRLQEHLATHLEEIALGVLPVEVEEDEDEHMLRTSEIPATPEMSTTTTSIGTHSDFTTWSETLVPDPQHLKTPSRPVARSKSGRKGSLDGETRARANQMRKLGACWVCTFQRDRCDAGSPCGRCASRSMRDKSDLLPCIRLHLSDLSTKFTSPSVTQTFKRMEVMAMVQESVDAWRASEPFHCYLTSGGLGTLEWDLYEFRFSPSELLSKEMSRIAIGRNQVTRIVFLPLAVKEMNYDQKDEIERFLKGISEGVFARSTPDLFGLDDLPLSILHCIIGLCNGKSEETDVRHPLVCNKCNRLTVI
jgi:hypothetical protein